MASFLKAMKPEEFDVGGSGDMPPAPASTPSDKLSKTDEPRSSAPPDPTCSTASSSGVWTHSTDFFPDNSSVGDLDKSGFPSLTTSCPSMDGGDPGSADDGDSLSISVSQGGKKYVITKRNLIVNYLPQTFSDRQLFNLFVSYGPIDSVKIMRDATTGYSYGFGFVNFVNESDGVRARAEMNGTQVENKRIKVSFARPPSDDIKDTNLYVTNLPRNMTEENLFALFAPFGEIVQRKLLVDRYTNLPRGVAFIRFERRDQAAAAINALNNYVPQGANEPIRIRLAEDHGKQKAAYLAGFRAGMGLPNGAPGGHGKVTNGRSSGSWQYSGKRSVDGWNYDKRSRGPLCNNSMMDGYWTGPESLPPQSVPAASGPYVFPGGSMAPPHSDQHPFCTDWGYPVTYAVRSADEVPSYAWRSSLLYPY